MRRLTRVFALFGLAVTLLLMGALTVHAGYENTEIPDPRSSEGKSGVDTPREHFPLPNPAYEKHDSAEFGEYHKTTYSPYAALQVLRPLQIGEARLKQGYYLVKLEIHDPPQPLNVPSERAGKTSWREKWRQFWSNPSKPSPPPKRNRYPSMAPNPEDPSAPPPRINLVIKQQGEVDVVIPAMSSRQRPESKRRTDMATLELEAGNPLQPTVVYLTYCVAKICYRSAPLSPGLVE